MLPVNKDSHGQPWKMQVLLARIQCSECVAREPRVPGQSHIILRCAVPYRENFEFLVSYVRVCDVVC